MGGAWLCACVCANPCAPPLCVLPQFARADDELDAAGATATGLAGDQGKQRFEKMVSGRYLGELARLCMVQLAAGGALWQRSRPGSEFMMRGSLRSEDMAAIGGDATRELEDVSRVLAERWHVAESSREDRATVVDVCALVARRAARLVAAAIAGITTKMGLERGGCSAGVDGSVFTCVFGRARGTLRGALFVERGRGCLHHHGTHTT